MAHKTSFEEFWEETNLPLEVGEKLKAGKICSARELACSETSKISELVDDCVLNTILPVLQKHKLKLVMSKDPNGDALKYLRRLADDDTKLMASPNRIASDTTGFVDNSPTPSAQQRNQLPSSVKKDETHKGLRGYRDTEYGSWYVTALCKIFEKHAKSEDVLSMMTMVNEAVMAEKEVEGGQTLIQMCQLDPKLQKKVKFFP